MTVAINAVSAFHGAGVHTTADLLAHWDRSPGGQHFVVIYARQQARIASVIPPSMRRIPVHVPSNPFGRVLWEQFVLPLVLWWNEVDVLYSVGNITSILAPCRIVLIMENSNPFSHIGLPLTLRERLRNRLLFSLGRYSAWRADRIRFVSESASGHMRAAIRVPPAKCVVIPHGTNFTALASPVPPSTPPIATQRPYVLTVGVNAIHRNTPRLLHAFAQLIQRYGYAGNLVIVGQVMSTQYQAELQRCIEHLGLTERVHLTGEIPHDAMRAYFQHAEAFIFPSVEETFGIPLIEAMALGVPVAASDCDLDPTYRGKCFNPFREICRDAADYFNPFRIEAITESLHRVLANPAYRRQLVARGKERSSAFQLKDTAQALVRLFADALR